MDAKINGLVRKDRYFMYKPMRYGTAVMIALMMAGSTIAAAPNTGSTSKPSSPTTLPCAAPRWIGPIPSMSGIRNWTRWTWSFANRVGNPADPTWSETQAPWVASNRVALAGFTASFVKALSAVWGYPTVIWTPRIAMTFTPVNGGQDFSKITTPYRTETTLIWGILQTPKGVLVNTLPEGIPAKAASTFSSGVPFRAAFAISLTAALSTSPGPTNGKVIDYVLTPSVLPTSGPPVTTLATANAAIAANVQAWARLLPASSHLAEMTAGVCPSSE